MAREAPPVTHAVPDASLVVKWHIPDESGWDHALTFYQSLEAGAIQSGARRFPPGLARDGRGGA